LATFTFVNASVRGMEMESIVMLAVTALMMVYLLFALLYPEKF
jgi:K+-transporting ATPase KdpF subunit